MSPRRALLGQRLVAYQGEAGAYSEEGAMALFPDTDLQPYSTIRKVFEAVEVGRVDLGLVPMDNSQAGSINETYDLFLKHGLHLVGETVVRVDHCLLALPGSTIDNLVEVISHPQALAQSEEFLGSLGVSVRAEYDTAGAAKRIVDNKLEGTAAIASKRAAALYGLDVLAERIQTYPDNYTRFGALSRYPSALSDPNKTSLVFGVSHAAGSLYRCIGAFAERDISLSKLESRPRAGRPWEYVFYVDVEVPATEASVIEALAEVSGHSTFTRVLGNYPRALPALVSAIR